MMKLSMKRSAQSFLCGVALLCLHTTVLAQGSSDTAFVVYPEYRNVLTNAQDNPVAANSLALFSGNVGVYSAPGSVTPPVIPSGINGANGTPIQLASSGFGQMVARTVPFPNFELVTINNAQRLLYPADPPPDATARDVIASSTAAFRYKQILYNSDTQGTNATGEVRVEFETIETLFTDADRIKARQGIDELRQALKYAPLHKKLRNAILDAYYDLVIAEVQHAKNDLAGVAKLRLGLEALPPGEFIVDREIQAYTNILNNYDGILVEYGRLFADNSGIKVSQIDPSARPGLTLGQYIFAQEQPLRNQMAAQYRDTNGILTTVSYTGSNATNLLFAGFKDYVALLGVLREYAQSAAELAKLYGIRGASVEGEKDDKTLGFELIQSINNEVFLTRTLLDSLLPDAIPGESDPDAAGLRAALAGVLAKTAELNRIGGFLSGQVNVLGFDPDFLILINKPPPGVFPEGFRDSYDVITAWIDHPSGADTSILGRARKTYQTARDNYDKYRGYADQVFNEMDAKHDSYGERYREISGYFPGEEPDPLPAPYPADRYPQIGPGIAATHINNPRAGSELRQLYLSVEQANTKEAELNLFYSKIETQRMLATARLDASDTRLDNIVQATKTYQTVIRKEKDDITYWNVRQAGMQAAYDMTADVGSQLAASDFVPTWGGAAAVATAAMGVANIAIQTKGEQVKGDSERDLELAAADFDKDLALADADQNVFQAGEEYRNIERELQAMTLSKQDNDFVRNQDLARIEGFLRELDQAAIFRNENDSELAGRYYADPIHFLRAQNSMIRADFAFREAQRWVFFTLRALEYKYNEPFNRGGYELKSLFKLRNFEELEGLLAQMTVFDVERQSALNGLQEFTHTISLKDNFWGRAFTNSQDRADEFQRKFTESLNENAGKYELKLNLLTIARALQDQDRSFFEGADYGPNGNLITEGWYLDKIDWIKVKFVDTSAGSDDDKSGNLSYGGTTYGRPKCALSMDGGTVRTSELQSFPFRFYKLQPQSDGFTTTVEANQASTILINFSNNTDIGQEPIESFRQDFWKERSVVASDFTLSIASDKVDINTLQDVQIYIRHRFYPREICLN